MDLFCWTFALIGHIGFWCVIFNFIHSTALPRSFRKNTEKVILFAVALPVIFFLVLMIWRNSTDFYKISEFHIAKYFLCLCMVVGFFFFFEWLYRKITKRLPAAVSAHKTKFLNIKHELGADIFKPGVVKAIGQLPFNECLKLTTTQMTFNLDVPDGLDGLKICQLSDLHFTGQIGIEFFKRIVKEANKFEPDLIFITGDLVDEAECLPWLEPTLGQLKSKLGTYYVLGNHDLRIKDESSYRKQLADIGLIQASQAWHEIEVNGAKIHLTGNERPWYKDVDKLMPQPNEVSDLRICLSHSPDQLEWALARHFDLMFAGHTHGGQIAFPLIGPLVAPSKYGVLYAAGTFQIDDMIMHVSRGLSGDEPIRLCCPPEIGLFTIKSRRPNTDA